MEDQQKRRSGQMVPGMVVVVLSDLIFVLEYCLDLMIEWLGYWATPSIDLSFR